MSGSVLMLTVVSLSVLLAAPQDEGEGSAGLYGGLTLSQWQERLGTFDPSDPHNATAVPALIAILQDSELSADERRPFAMTLGRMGTTATSAVPVLIAQIQQRRELGKPTYSWAARALGLFGVHAKDAAPALIDLLFDEDIPRGERTLPVEALARIGTAHPEVMPAMIRLLQYEGFDRSRVSASDAALLRELAAEGLAMMGPEADLAAPLLMRVVRDRREGESMRRKAMVALGSMGERAALAIPALVETLEFEESRALREAAGESLGRIGAPAASIMLQYLQHSDPKIRLNVARGLGSKKLASEQVVSTLVATLDDPDDEVRLAVCESLAVLTPDASSYAAALVQLLTSPQRQVRMGAMRLMVDSDEKVGPYRHLLLELRDDPRSEVRSIVEKTLAKLPAQ